jgi:hypothetical protein
MQSAGIYDQARTLWELFGPKAIAVAAKKARDLEKQGEKDEAETWRRIEAALVVRRGAHQS